MNENLPGKTILIVEDEVEIREPLVSEFEYQGCKVFEAANGKAALEIVKREKIDAIISDIRMPGGDGVELLRSVKELDHTFPVVMLITGFSDLSREDAYHYGAEAILAKPFDLDEIGATVNRILTPKQILWDKKPAENKIKTKIEQTFPAISQAIQANGLGLGRGGIFLKLMGRLPVRGERVALRISFEDGEVLSIEGSGIVRWVRAAPEGELPEGCGIEFDSLTAQAREQVLALVDEMKLGPFIPKAPYPAL